MYVFLTSDMTSRYADRTEVNAYFIMTLLGNKLELSPHLTIHLKNGFANDLKTIFERRFSQQMTQTPMQSSFFWFPWYRTQDEWHDINDMARYL